MPAEKPRPRRESLWSLIVAPAIWLAHFLLAYVTSAVWCAKFAGAQGSLSTARVAIAVYTVIALVALAIVGARALRRRGAPGAGDTREFDRPDDRLRFLGQAGFLLTGLSALAIVYTALVAVFIRSCE